MKEEPCRAEQVEQGNPLGGEVGTLGKSFALHIPTKLLRLTEWSLEPSPLMLVAQLRAAGWIRLHLAADAHPKIEAIRLQIRQDDTPDQLEKLAVLADQYRYVKLHTANNQRVQLDRTTTSYLGLAQKDNRAVFIEARKSAINIMSLEFRNRRLDDWRDEMSIDE